MKMFIIKVCFLLLKNILKEVFFFNHSCVRYKSSKIIHSNEIQLFSYLPYVGIDGKLF